jgi:hypothetical protein
MPIVELVYDPGCPNVAGARAQLQRAFSLAKVGPRWQEWNIADPGTPARLRGYGSPTVLVDGRDVSGGEPVDAASCRLYPQHGETLRGVPSVRDIVAALRSGDVDAVPVAGGGVGWRSSAATLPAICVSLLPKVACPACWPAYAGLLSSVGLGFVVEARYLLPLTAAFLSLALGALAFRARRRRGHGPFLLGLLAAAAVLAGKFGFDSDTAMYGGLAALVGASLWNSWPRRQPVKCGACARGGATIVE